MTLVVHKVNMFSKSNVLKLNLISCHGNKRNLKRRKGRMIGDLNGFKSN